MKNSVTNGFDRMSPPDLIAKASFIVGEMATNVATFPAPNPALGDVKAAIDDFANAAFAAENGDRVAIAYRNELKGVLVTMLRQLGSYVNLIANGNRTIALTSGFNVARESGPVPPIEYVNPPQLSPGVNAGQLSGKTRRVPGATSYLFYINNDVHKPISQWTQYADTKSQFRFSGLESGKRYHVCVAAIGRNNQLVYSEPSSMIVQ